MGDVNRDFATDRSVVSVSRPHPFMPSVGFTTLEMHDACSWPNMQETLHLAKPVPNNKKRGLSPWRNQANKVGLEF